MSAHKCLFMILSWLISTACFGFQTLNYTASTGPFTPTLDGEMPDYTIANEYVKHAKNFPYITPVDPTRSGQFQAFENIEYDASNHLQLDLYTPTNAQNTPVMLLIHGGGWRSGSRAHMVPIAKSMAEHGIAAAAVSYRTSRQALYPAGMQDIEKAMAWLENNQSKYSLNMQKVGILGASSGAHMATLLGHRLNQQQQKQLIIAVINFDGVVETTSDEVRYFEDRPGKTSYLALWLGGRFHEQPSLWQEASPLNFTDRFAPSTFFVNSSQPRFHRGRDEMLALLTKNHIANGFYEVAETPHTFWLFHPWHDEALQKTLQFLQSVFGMTNKPLPSSHAPLDREHLDITDAENRNAWQRYFKASEEWLLNDQTALKQEDPNNTPMQWRKRNTYEGWQFNPVQIDNLITWQTPSGGWSKNHDVLYAARAPGQAYGEQNHYVPTFDNGATLTEIKLLKTAIVHQPEQHYIESLHKAIRLILQAQFPSGGWPQTFPLRGGYHNWSTYNDGVTANILNALLDMTQQPQNYKLDNVLLNEVSLSLEQGLASVLREQRWMDDQHGAWGQQHDPLSGDLRPARAFEMAALSTMESADIAMFLMQIPTPSPAVIRAIKGTIAWLESTQITGLRWKRYTDQNSELIADSDAPIIWPRMIDLNDGRALFGDRDGSIHYSVQDISIERQRSYAWYHSGPQSALKEFDTWLKHH